MKKNEQMEKNVRKNHRKKRAVFFSRDPDFPNFCDFENQDHKIKSGHEKNVKSHKVPKLQKHCLLHHSCRLR